jgi:outer membrane protein assembly factor BamB
MRKNTELPPDLEVSNPKGRIIGDFFYVSATKDNGRIHEFTRVLRTPIHDGKNWEEIYRLNAKDIGGYSPNIYNIGIWQNPQTTDSILLFNTRMLHWTTGKERSDVVAYNLSQRRVEWTIDSISKLSEVYDPIYVFKNKLYFETWQGVQFVDLLNKELIKRNIELGIDEIEEDKERIIGRSDGDVVVLDLQLNELLRIKKKEYFAPIDMEVFEDYIYAVNPKGDLYVFSIKTGKIVFQHFSQAMFVPQSVLGMDGRCSVDKEHRLLYAADKYGVYCMKLPEKWE